MSFKDDRIIYSNLRYVEFENVIIFVEPKVASTYFENISAEMGLKRYMYGEWRDNSECTEPDFTANKEKILIVREPMEKFCSAQNEEIHRMIESWDSDSRNIALWCAARKVSPEYLKDFYERLVGYFYSVNSMLDKNNKPLDKTTRIGIEFICDLYSIDYDISPIFNEAHTRCKLFRIYNGIKHFSNMKYLDIKDLDNATDYLDKLIPGYKEMITYKLYSKHIEGGFPEDLSRYSLSQDSNSNPENIIKHRKSYITEQLKSLKKLKKLQNVSYMDNILDEDLKRVMDNEIKTYNEIKKLDSFLKF
jgi:hypothetical protein